MCGDDIDIIDGHPTGSVRISFGYMSTFKDAHTFLNFIITTRLSGCSVVDVPRRNCSEALASAQDISHTFSSNSVKSLPLKRIIKDSQPSTPSAPVIVPNNLQPMKRHPERGLPDIFGKAVEAQLHDKRPITVTNIYLYPIKSCAAFEVMPFPVIFQEFLFLLVILFTLQLLDFKAEQRFKGSSAHSGFSFLGRCSLETFDISLI